MIRSRILVAVLAVWTLAVGCAAPNTRPAAHAEHGMVSTIHPIATDAAVQVMRDGGNAIDAAVEAALMLGVVDGHNSGIGGGCFMLVRLADGRVFALDGREMAPAHATRDMFIRDGKGDTKLSQTGPLASGVPGSLAVYQYATEHFGRKKLADLLHPPADVAEHGFPINSAYAKKLKSSAPDIAKFEGTRAILLKPDGTPYRTGDILKQPDLAHTYREIATQGTDYFYKGDFARAVGQWMATNGGVMTADDFANYKLKLRAPLSTTYRGYTVIGFPPPSSGGVHVAEMLNILESFDLKSMSPADRVHVTAEAMKLAFADRAYWLGDPDYANVPRGLIDKSYGQQLAKKISMDHAGHFDHGTPPAAEDIFGRKHTTHIATTDAEGNVVALTATVNTSFGSKVIVPGTGVILNNQMDDFSIQPGVANHFGLVGADANAVAPGKRPLSSMSPTIILKDNKLVLTVGAAGGPKIITQVLLATTNVIDLGDDAHTALARPRYHHQWSPDELWIENTFDKHVMDELRKRGHKLNVAEPAGASQLILVDPADGSFWGQTETRATGKAAGY